MVEQKDVITALLGAGVSLAGLGMAFTSIVLAGGESLRNNLTNHHGGWPSYGGLLLGGAAIVVLASLDAIGCIYWLAGKGQPWLGDQVYWFSVGLAILVTIIMVVFTVVCVPPLAEPAKTAVTALVKRMPGRPAQK
jgi:hypothetical protein